MIGSACVRGSSPRGALRAVLMLAAALGVVLAGPVGAPGCRSKAPVLEQTFESPEALARAVVKGLDSRDITALRALTVTEHEFRKLVWPKLPAARPGRNIPWDYVWKDLHGKSAMQLQARVNEWQRGGDGEVVKVEFAGETTDYESFRVRRRSVITVRTPAGNETRQRLFGSMIEENGRYKVFSYVVD